MITNNQLRTMNILADYHFTYDGYTKNSIVMYKRFKNDEVYAHVSNGGRVNGMGVNKFIEHILLMPLPEPISIIPSHLNIKEEAPAEEEQNEEV